MINKRIRQLLIAGIACCGVAVAFTACSEDIDESKLYVFNGQTIEDFLKDNPEEFSDFNYILSRIGYDKILSSYGTYTCFAPHNKAVQQYVDSLYNDQEDEINWTVGSQIVHGHNGMTAPGLEGLTDSLCIDIALYHLLYTEVLSIKLNAGASFRTILERDINTTIDAMGDVVINNDTKLIPGQNNVDIELENGILHKVDHVFTRSNNMVSGELAKHPEFELFSQALNRTGLADTLILARDTSYVAPKKYITRTTNKAGTRNVYHPEESKVGWTIFAESDEVLSAAGITDWASLEKHAKEVYENCKDWYDYCRVNNIEVSFGNDYENKWNVVNMWVRYHLVKGSIPNDHLSYYDSHNKTPETPSVNYFETMLPMTMMRVSYERNEQRFRINRAIKNASLSDLAESTGSPAMDHGILLPGIEIERVQYQAVNGYIHPIKGLLEFKEETLQCFNERMRFDVAALMPELLSNGLRHISINSVTSMYPEGDPDGTVHIPLGFSRSFISYNNETEMTYQGQEETDGKHRRDVWESDEVIVSKQYDCAFRLPPVPKGTYEIRLGYKTITETSIHARGMMQVFIAQNTTDRNRMEPLDIPLDMHNVPHPENGMPDALTGWIDPTKTDDKGVETDISMRYHGFMRAPFGMLGGGGDGRSSRYATGSEIPLRRILTTRELEQDHYWLRFKRVLPTGTLDMDYLEIVPLSVYNNAEYSEDMY